MGKHDIKSNRIQANEILSYEQLQIVVKNILSYSEGFTLDDFDLVYKKYVDDIFSDFSGSNTFVDHFETYEQLLEVPSEEIPPGGYAYVGSGEDFAVFFWDEIGESWVAGGGSAVMTPEQIRDALQTLTGNFRLDASAIKNLPNLSETNRVLNPGNLTLVSETEINISDPAASWIWNKNTITFSGNRTLPTKPVDPNNQFVIITVGASGVPVVEAGAAEPTPSIPNPATPGDLVLHTIYRPFDGEDFVIPTAPVYATRVQQGQWAGDGLTHIYAPIWRQTMQKNTYYGFNIAFCHWSSDYNTYGQRPKNGILMVSFVTGANNTLIDANRTVIETRDVSVNNGDFVLVQTSPNEVTLFAKKGTYLGNMVFDYLLPKFATVKDGSLVNNGAYDALPLEGDRYFSTNGSDYVPSTGTTIRFDKPRIYGPLTGNLTISTAYANAGYMAEVVHNAATEPAINVPSGVTLIKLGGEYEPGIDNIFLFVCRKGGDTTTMNGNNVTSIWYTISQDQL